MQTHALMILWQCCVRKRVFLLSEEILPRSRRWLFVLEGMLGAAPETSSAVAGLWFVSAACCAIRPTEGFQFQLRLTAFQGIHLSFAQKQATSLLNPGLLEGDIMPSLLTQRQFIWLILAEVMEALKLIKYERYPFLFQNVPIVWGVVLEETSCFSTPNQSAV